MWLFSFSLRFRDIPPQNGQDVYFSRDLYEKYSLAPTLSELMSLSKRNHTLWLRINRTAG
uniref:Uncharacterized protein n=1 Tax=Pseudonaja textilis TaxID=8673 RepID=A0A670ZKD1_PSETE